MTHTEQVSCQSFLEEKKSKETPMNDTDPKLVFLDSLDKLLVELDDLTEVTAKYFENFCNHQKKQGERRET